MSSLPPAEDGFLRHPLLVAAGVDHGFGTRVALAPTGLLRPHQVHGIGLARAGADGRLDTEDADAVVSHRPGIAVGIVTADCVPVLAATESGRAGVAIHAGWRGVAAGVVAAGLAGLRAHAQPGEGVVAVIGPRIGACCYEVDGPVMDPLRARFGTEANAAATDSRPGHYQLDLGRLVALDLARCGMESRRIGLLEDVCTACGVGRFHSHRRDGAEAGRLVHYVGPRAAPGHRG